MNRRLTVAVVSDTGVRKSRLDSFIGQMRETFPLRISRVLVINNGGKHLGKDSLGSGNFKILNTTSRIGLSSCWNAAMENAEFEWVLICNDDLIFPKGWVKDFQNILQQNPNRHVFLLSNPNGFSCFAITKTFWKKISGFREGFPGGYYEDDDFFLRVAKMAGLRYKKDMMKSIFYSHFDETGKTLIKHSPEYFERVPGWNKHENKVFFDNFWQLTYNEDPDGIENKNGVWYKEVK